MKPLQFTVAALAVWRLTHLLHAEEGPFGILAECRNWLRRKSLSGGTDCFYCLSLWVAAPFAIALESLWEERITLWLSLSGAAILANHAVQEKPEMAWFYEEPTREERVTCRAAEMENES